VQRTQVAFRLLERSDFSVLARWLSEPHVRPWFHGAAVDNAFVEETYSPVVERATSKRGFIIVVDGRDLGYAETYRGEDHAAFFAALEVDPIGTAGCDLLLGEPPIVGRGLGTVVIRQFTTDVIFSDRQVARSIAGPDLRNERSQRAFARAGYRVLHRVQVPGDGAPAVVMEAKPERET
jgi:aminoglycoside 6'-N-acetyltransferase